MQHIDTSWGDVAYDDRGDGPPVVLLHATAHDHRDFDAVVPALNHAGFRTLAVDGRGTVAPPGGAPRQP